jgi:hypothetical protein
MVVAHLENDPELGRVLVIGLTFDQLTTICVDCRPVAFQGGVFRLGTGRIFLAAGGMESAIRAQFDDTLGVVDLTQEDVDELTEGRLVSLHFSDLGLEDSGFVHVLCDGDNDALLQGFRVAGLLPDGADIRAV